MEVKECSYCKLKFKPKNKLQLYCTSRCRQQNWESRNPGRKAELCKEWYDNNKEHVKVVGFKWRSKNKDKIKKNVSKWKKENREKHLANRRNQHHSKMENDNLYKAKQQYRGVINNAFRKKRFTKDSNTTVLIGCSYDELHIHLKKTFTDRYNIKWNDEYMSKIHVDHIIPCSSAKSVEELKKLQHYTNLQLLWDVDNMKKGSSHEC